MWQFEHNWTAFLVENKMSKWLRHNWTVTKHNNANNFLKWSSLSWEGVKLKPNLKVVPSFCFERAFFSTQSKLQQLSCRRRSQWSILQCLFYWSNTRQSTWALPEASHFHTALISASPLQPSLCLLCFQQGEEETAAGYLLTRGWALPRRRYNQTWVRHSAPLPIFLFWISRNLQYVLTLTLAGQDCIPSPQSGSPHLCNAAPPPSNRLSQSLCAPSCCEPPC